MNTSTITLRVPDIEPMRGVYRPVADSRLLAEAFAQDEIAEPLDVLDLCCGSGIQGIAAAMRGHRVDAVDADHCAVISARRNALLNGVNLRVLEGDLFRPVRGRAYEAILVNPPYVPTPTSGSFRAHTWSDGGDDGRLLIDRICRAAPAFLAPGGSLWMVHSSLADINASAAMLSDFGLQVTEVAEHYEPFGPVTSERMEYLLARGYVKTAQSAERLVVLKATLESD